MGNGASLATVYDQGVNDWLMGKAAEWIHPSDTVALKKLQQKLNFCYSTNFGSVFMVMSIIKGEYKL